MKIYIYLAIAVIICILIAIGLSSIFTATFKVANEMQYYEVSNDSAKVQIHTHMPIDSVELLLGTPQKYHTYSVAGSEYHTYEYLYPGSSKDYDLKLEFKDSKLISVEQK